MKMIEISFNKHQKELEKLNAQLERAKKAYGKKLLTAQKYGVADWSIADKNEWLSTVPTTENGFIINSSDIKKNGAWFDLFIAKDTIKDITERIEKAENRLYKAEQKVNEYYEELEKIADLKAKEEFRKLQFEQEQKEWAKDGITLKGRYYGATPQGNKFLIAGNNGFTNRSLHCFQLVINGETIFTSGEFWRAYSVIKSN